MLQEKISELEDKKKEEAKKREADRLRLPYMNLHGLPILSDALRLIDKKTAQKYKVVCFFYAQGRIHIGFSDPAYFSKVQEIARKLEEKHHVKATMYLISSSSFEAAFRFYDILPQKREIKKGVEIREEDILRFQREIKSFRDLSGKIKGAEASEVIEIILASALKMNASDVHIEVGEQGVAIRFRIDGVLHKVTTMSKDQWKTLTSRIKLLSGMKLNISQKPQDGHFTIFFSGDKVEVRTSTVPTVYGESVVMRILRSSSLGLKFDDLGFRGAAHSALAEQIKRPNGMIITTGPTGSGKTTTLYAVLNVLNAPETKILTLEDPIEYQLPGVNQSQVDAEHGYSFARALRSILRQDPDIIMVGEIRDEETAEIAINAALTGHLVLSTLHTNSAAGAIPRFLSMKAKPFLLAPALNAVIGQRLVRRICSSCKREDALDDATRRRVMDILGDLPETSEQRKKIDKAEVKFYKGAGCEDCHGLGYKGRVGIFEVLVMGKELERMVLSGKIAEHEVENQAKKQGMVTMVQDGILKALDGITSVEEVLKKVE